MIRIEFTKEYTWFDNFYAYWIIKNTYDGINFKPIYEKYAMSLSLKNIEDAADKAEEIISILNSKVKVTNI